jgi:hypothetical protein
MPRIQHQECHGRIENDDDAVPHGRLDLGGERRDLQESDVSKFNKAVECSHCQGRLVVQWVDEECVNQRRGHPHGVYQPCQHELTKIVLGRGVLVCARILCLCSG